MSIYSLINIIIQSLYQFNYLNKNHKHQQRFKKMTTNATSIVTITEITDTVSLIQSKVIATGVALLFVYSINFVCQALATFVKKQGEEKQYALRKILETSQVMYWFGIAVMFSIFPPFYYGTFHTVMSFITLIVVILMHIFSMTDDKRAKGRSLWSIMYFIYHFLITLWIIVALVMAFIWSQNVYIVK